MLNISYRRGGCTLCLVLPLRFVVFVSPTVDQCVWSEGVTFAWPFAVVI